MSSIFGTSILLIFNGVPILRRLPKLQSKVDYQLHRNVQGNLIIFILFNFEKKKSLTYDDQAYLW